MFLFRFVHICHSYCTMSKSLFFPDAVYKRYASNEPNSNDSKSCRLVGLVVSGWHRMETASSSEVMSKIRPRRLVAQCSKRASHTIWFHVFTSDTLHVLFRQYVDVILPTMALYSNVLVIVDKTVLLDFYCIQW